jgi:quinol monooxygenase YgiN
MSLRLTVQFNIQEGKAADFEAAAGAAIKRVKAEDKGCEMYDLFKSVDDDTRYVLVESWASQEDIDAHGKSPAMAEMQKIGPFMAGRPTMHRYSD